MAAGELANLEIAADEQSVATRTAEVGARIRKAREARGLTRRELSERSGISQRYLAQVEAGEGNISVALLFRVAAALDRPVEGLLGRPTPDEEAQRIAQLVAAADETTRRNVLNMLTAQSGRRARRVALIGLRGAGKSTLGRRAAERLALPFVELNHEIETASGMPVADVMAFYGQEGYRALEKTALDRVTAEKDIVVLAVAGGIVSAPETFEMLLDRFHTIWLRASPQEHMDRVRAQGDERPMAGNPAALDDLKAILEAREALYARAEAVLDTAGRSEEDSLADLLDILASRAFLV